MRIAFGYCLELTDPEATTLPIGEARVTGRDITLCWTPPRDVCRRA